MSGRSNAALGRVNKTKTNQEIGAEKPADDVAMRAPDKHSMIKLRILNDKVSASVNSITPTSFLMRNGVEISDIQAVEQLVQHTSSVIADRTSGQLKATLEDLSTCVDRAQALLSPLPVVTPSTPSTELDFLTAVQTAGGAAKIVRVHAELKALLDALSEMSQAPELGPANEILSRLSFNVSLWSTLNYFKMFAETVHTPACLKVSRKHAREIMASFSDEAPCPEAYQQRLMLVIEGKAAEAVYSSESEASAAITNAKAKAKSKAAKAKAKTKATKASSSELSPDADE